MAWWWRQVNMVNFVLQASVKTVKKTQFFFIQNTNKGWLCSTCDDNVLKLFLTTAISNYKNVCHFKTLIWKLFWAFLWSVNSTFYDQSMHDATLWCFYHGWKCRRKSLLELLEDLEQTKKQFSSIFQVQLRFLIHISLTLRLGLSPIDISAHNNTIMGRRKKKV